MKRYLFLALSAVFLAALVAPNALAVKIRIADPAPDLTYAPPPNNYVCDGVLSINSNTPCNIYSVGHPYTVSFITCQPLLANSGVDTTGFTYCLWLNNFTGGPVASFKFDLTVPTGAGGESLGCDSDPTTLYSITCPSPLPGDDDLFTLWFGSNPALVNRTQFFLLTDFESMPDPASVTVFRSQPAGVPEPGALGLFGLGLLVIGVGYGLQRRRRQVRGNEVI